MNFQVGDIGHLFATNFKIKTPDKLLLLYSQFENAVTQTNKRNFP